MQVATENVYDKVGKKSTYDVNKTPNSDELESIDIGPNKGYDVIKASSPISMELKRNQFEEFPKKSQDGDLKKPKKKVHRKSPVKKVVRQKKQSIFKNTLFIEIPTWLFIVYYFFLFIYIVYFIFFVLVAYNVIKI